MMSAGLIRRSGGTDEKEHLEDEKVRDITIQDYIGTVKELTAE